MAKEIAPHNVEDGQQYRRIALFGGSFDPPHLGHEALVDAAFKHLNLDEVWVIPVGLPVHRQLSGKATPTQRLAWLASMFAENMDVRIMDWEINHDKPTPTVDTLRRFRAENPDIIPLWLMGMDSFLDMPNWLRYPEHQTLCNVVVFQRKGEKEHIKTSGWKAYNHENAWGEAGHVLFLDVDLPDISSTLIRKNVRAHRDQLSQSNCNAILACYGSDAELASQQALEKEERTK